MANVVRSSVRLDPTVYPVDEKVGEHILQRWIAEMLRPLIERWLAHRGKKAFVGADQFMYYRQHMPTARVAPDVYVLPGVAPDHAVGAWKVWETGIVPSFALEVVSRDWEKDYVDGPERYTELGVGELIIFDPAPDKHAERVRWQIYRQVRRRGLVRVEVSAAPAVTSKALGCNLVRIGSGMSQRLRLGTEAHGTVLFPTAEEAERAAKEAERAAKEAERAAKEAERAEKEAERAGREAERAGREAERIAKEAALARVVELEKKLRRRGARSR